MMQNKLNNQSGFSLVELVIVIIILGLLAVTALPRLLNVTEDAEGATVEGVAGGFATGVGLVRAQWELDGRPNDADDGNTDNIVSVTLDTIVVGVDETSGYPTGAGSDGDTNSAANQMTAADCEQVFVRILQSAPAINDVYATAVSNDDKYFVRIASSSECAYYLVQSIKNLGSAPTNTNTGNGFTYVPSTGQVTVFTN